jgi:hypothetical protein
MLVHSFSQELIHFDDYAAFVRLYDRTAEPGRLINVGQFGDITLHLGWVVGDADYLSR